jgi:ElaB/YqjD/DUF883 family membrane-anchored ribosome-binding protein
MTKAILKKKPRIRHRIRVARVVHNGLDLQHRLEHIKDSLGNLSENISDKASDVVAHSIKKARRQSRLVGRYVHNKPYRSLGIAVIAVLALGFIFRK